MQWKKQGVIFDPHHAQVPVAIELDDCIRVYYATRDGQNRSSVCFFDCSKHNPAIIIRQSKEPCLSGGAIGEFDHFGTMPTSILFHDGKFWMYYIGWSCRKDVPYHNAVGIATSEDGVLFEKTGGPVLSSCFEEPGFVGTAHVRKNGVLWESWYLSNTEWIQVDDRLEPRYHIKYSTSQDGIHWSRNNQVAIDYIDEQEGGLSHVSVVQHQGKYHMWYSHRKATDYRWNIARSYRIGYAVSYDGIHWNRLDHQSGINVSLNGWDSQMICYPSILQQSDRLLMFYNGNAFGKTGIGWATLNLRDIL